MDLSPLRKWDFRGRDALLAADRIFTNDMLGLERGQIRYAPFCDLDGKMVGDGTVFKFDDEHAWVITALDSDLEHFEQVAHFINRLIDWIKRQTTSETTADMISADLAYLGRRLDAVLDADERDLSALEIAHEHVVIGVRVARDQVVRDAREQDEPSAFRKPRMVAAAVGLDSLA